MKTVEIEWRRLVQGGATCERCGTTGDVLRQLVEQLNAECLQRGVAIVLKTVALGTERIAESNQILIDGQALEQLRPQIVIGRNNCRSCGRLLGQEQACRTLEFAGETHDVPPAWLIREAVCRSAGCC
jgi:ribosomal protein S14